MGLIRQGIVATAYSNSLPVNEACSSEAQAVDSAEYRTLLTNAKSIVVDIRVF